jgi:hypothetical protein
MIFLLSLGCVGAKVACKRLPIVENPIFASSGFNPNSCVAKFNPILVTPCNRPVVTLFHILPKSQFVLNPAPKLLLIPTPAR